MAEGFVNARYGDRYEAYSAGSEPTEVHPCAIEVMAEEGIDIISQRAKPLDQYVDASFDYVVTCVLLSKRDAPFSREPFSREGSSTSITPLTILSRMRGLKVHGARLLGACATESENGSRSHFLKILEPLAILVEKFHA